MSADPNHAKSIFLNAADRPAGPDREGYLAEACGPNAALRREVDELLAHFGQVGSFLDSPAAPTADLPPRAEVVGTMVGPYKLVEMIGEGGMGTVWLARQTDPVKRQVAVKLIKPGMDSRQVLARFEAERQALALMDHPNIARVFDAGATAEGRPYFVMELVKGVPITRFCDDHHLTPRQRLELFVPVCHAIQHAHQKGVIHRDIKPSNVLVALYDDKPVPKVIDFGVAKATGQQLTEETLHSGFGAVVGTVEYMSPEQATFNQLDIDTRSDIYSLGVLLYELVAGSPPFTKRDLEKAGILEMLRVIREDEPSRPSTKLSTAEGLPTLAANRGTEPAKLTRLVRGELDWIVLKALEKDRNRRYETANGFAQDVRRYLADEAVQACPPSPMYRLRKFVRRNRGPVLAVSAMFLLLVGGVTGTSVGMVRARDAQRAESDRADAEARERARATAAEADARAKEKDAADSLALARAITSFLRSDLLGQAGSHAQAGRRFDPNPNLTVREALDRAAAAVGDRFRDRPEVEAAVRKTIGDAYTDLGQPEKAIPHLRRAADLQAGLMAPTHRDLLITRHSLALALRDAGQVDAAVAMFEELRDLLTASVGPEDAHTLLTLNNLAVAYRLAGRRPAARALFQHVTNVRSRTLGPDHEVTLSSLYNLGMIDVEDGNLAEAVPRLRHVRDVWLRVLGPRDPATLDVAHSLAIACWKAGRLDESIPAFEQVVALSRQIHGGEHPITLAAAANLGVNYRDAGRIDEAIRLLKPAHDRAGKSPDLRFASRELLFAHARSGRTAETAAFATEYLAAVRPAHKAGSLSLAVVLAETGGQLLDVKAWETADPILREALEIRQKLAKDDWRTFATQSMLGAALRGQRKHAEAEPLLLRGYEGMKEREAKIPANARRSLPDAVERLVQLYDAWDRPEEAKKWRAERAKYPNLAPPPREKK
jgi:non-specific serine/threonine protein kinase/serine/threonine-protein kinase